MPELALFYPEGHEAHFESGHPERPDRVEAVRRGLVDAGWWAQAHLLAPSSIPDPVYSRIHTLDYLDQLQQACNWGWRLDGDTYTRPASWDLARQAAEGAAAVAEIVWQSAGSEAPVRGFALCRPPGHHATRQRGMGFCLLNNVALAAQYLIDVHGARRLAIVDLDLHHGNGTQDIFWEREDVFYISTHQAPFYPGTGSLHERGGGAGLGTTANFPLPAGSGDEALLACLEQVSFPLLAAYQPEMILVSFGFDPHWRDPLGSFLVTADGFGRSIAALRDFSERFCRGRIALFLEGGYDLLAGAACASAACAALIGAPWEDPLGAAPFGRVNSWKTVIERARQIWDIQT